MKQKSPVLCNVYILWRYTAAIQFYYSNLINRVCKFIRSEEKSAKIKHHKHQHTHTRTHTHTHIHTPTHTRIHTHTNALSHKWHLNVLSLSWIDPRFHDFRTRIYIDLARYEHNSMYHETHQNYLVAFQPTSQFWFQTSLWHTSEYLSSEFTLRPDS